MRRWTFALALALAGAGCNLDTAAIVAVDAAPSVGDAAPDARGGDAAGDTALDAGDLTDGAPDAPPGDAPLGDTAPADATPPGDAPPADAQPPGDAAPGDAAPGDAARDAGCTPVSLLGNGDFEQGRTVWTETTSGGFYLIYPTADLPAARPPQGGAFAAWLGGYNDANDLLWQGVAVPAGATALRLTGYRSVRTQEGTQPWDFVRLELRSPSDAVLETLLTYSNADATTGWQAFQATAQSSHAGTTVRLAVHATNDWVSNPTDFFFDTLGLEATVCP